MSMASTLREDLSHSFEMKRDVRDGKHDVREDKGDVRHDKRDA